jgi:hypothetical protein
VSWIGHMLLHSTDHPVNTYFGIHVTIVAPQTPVYELPAGNLGNILGCGEQQGWVTHHAGDTVPTAALQAPLPHWRQSPRPDLLPQR